MWSYRSTSVASAAIFVVSESGDILSPKYAPPITAPAIIARFALMTVATPKITTPIVPTDPHEVPVNKEKKIGIKKAKT